MVRSNFIFKDTMMQTYFDVFPEVKTDFTFSGSSYIACPDGSRTPVSFSF